MGPLSRQVTGVINRIKGSDVASRMANGAFWSFAGSSLARFVVLVAGIICARILGKEEYGEFGMIRSTINMFAIFGVAGLGLTATRFISEFRRSDPARIPSIYILTNGFALVTGAVITAAILISAPAIAAGSLNSPHSAGDLRWGALILFFTVLNGVQSGVLSGMERFKDMALNALCGSVGEAVFMVSGAYFYGITGAVTGYGIGYVIFAAGNHISIRNSFKRLGITVSPNMFRKSDLKLLWTFTVPAAVSSLLVAPVFWYIRSLLVRSNGYEELAVYEVADQWKVIILFIPTAVSQIVLPILSGMSEKETRKFGKVLRANIIINASISLVMASGVCLAAKYIMRLYGEGFTDTSSLIVLAASTIFSSVANVMGISIASRNKTWTGLVFNICWAVMVVLFSKYFIALDMGAKGLSLAVLCSYAVNASMQYIYLRKFIRQ